MSKARELAELIGNAGGTSEQVLSGRRNLIINGGFDVWQRGTSFSTGGIYTADRYFSYMGNVDKSSDVPVGAGVFSSALCSGVNTAALMQKVEDINIVRYSGQNLTFSLWAKGSGDVILASYDGTTTVNHATVTLTSEWQRFSVTINRTWTTHSVFQLQLTGNQTIYTTGWQLELGSTATPFEHRSYGEELALCQRYYWQTQSYLLGNRGYEQIGQGFVRTTSTTGSPITIQVPYPQVMRTTPSVALTNGNNFTAQVANNANTTTGSFGLWSVSGPRMGWIDSDATSTSGWATGQAISVYCKAGASDMCFDAEL